MNPRRPLQTYDEAEPAFARALAERAGLPAEDLRPAIWAAMFNAALRAAVEHHAWHTADTSADAATARAELAATLRTLSGRRRAASPDAPAPRRWRGGGGSLPPPPGAPDVRGWTFR